MNIKLTCAWCKEQIEDDDSDYIYYSQKTYHFPKCYFDMVGE